MRNQPEPPEGSVAKLKRAAEDALGAGSIGELLGIEGAAASQYFQQFSGMVKVEDDDLPGLEMPNPGGKQLAFNFNFSHRNRRPPTDPVNAMLSLAYSMLSKDCTLAALAVGFDPYVGFYHQPRFGRPALGLDLMEEFRQPVVDRPIFAWLFKNGSLKLENGLLDKESKEGVAARVLARLNATEPHRGKEHQVRSIIQMQARLAAAAFRERRPYRPFSFQW